jgi:triphosphoribosyl-dephospho-CoA synthase
MDLPPGTTNAPMKPTWTIGQCAALACLFESTATKPGNVLRGADFDDVTYPEFVASGIMIGPVMERAVDQPLGQTVLAAVTATRAVTATNTNLGTILLLAPLAAVPREQSLADGVGQVFRHLTAEDARDVYEAIRLATPGGLGSVDQADVNTCDVPDDLLSAMRLAADRDMVARQYAEDFHHVLTCAAPWLAESIAAGMTRDDAIVHVHLRLMSAFPDSLIARKCGAETAAHSADWAGRVLDSGSPDSEAYRYELSDLDFWLRSDGHHRNPGTTADLIAAGLFVVLRDGLLPGFSPRAKGS